jgi:O-antigen/teichoic acid export membrane protein
VSLFEDYEEVGFYALAYRVIELLGMLPAIVMTSVFPLLSRYISENRELARRTLDASADLFAALGVPLAAGGLVVAPQLVRLIGGDDFEGAADTLRILLFAGALAFVSGLFGMTLIAGDRQRSAMRLAIAALAFNVPLNFALVPSLGIDAAAAVAVASELLLVVGGALLVRRDLGLAPRVRVLWRALAAAAAMAGVLALVDDWSLALLVPLGAALYAAGLWALGGIDRRMLQALRA